MLGWDCGNLLVFLALAMFVRQGLGGSDPLPSCGNNLLAAPNSEQCMDTRAHIKPLVADLGMILPM